MFGGVTHDLYSYSDNGQQSTDIIAAFNTVTKTWKKSGYMYSERHYHGVVYHQNEFLTIGGWSYVDDAVDYKLRVGICTLQGDEITCDIVEPDIEYYMDYPEIMLVPYDYCPK